MLQLPGGAGLTPVLGNARRLADFTLPRGTFKRFDLEQVVRLLLDVSSGLAALHEVAVDGQPFVHGDVSPQHIYVDEYGTARLVPLLSSHLLLASPPEAELGYAAPERLAGQPLDARADVFSVGAMLWEALAGKRLFAEEGSSALTAAARQSVPPIRLAARVRWAEPLCAIAERAIAPEPAARFATALELSNAIAKAAALQLSRVDSDAWQEEAPTPVFQPRLHLATLRASTPPPSVLSIAPTDASPKVLEVATPEPAPTEATVAVLERPVRRGRKAVIGLVAVSLAAAAYFQSSSFSRLGHTIAALSPLVKLRAAAQPAMFVPLPTAATPKQSVTLPPPSAATLNVVTPSNEAAAPVPSMAASAARVKPGSPLSARAPVRPVVARPNRPNVTPGFVPEASPPKPKAKPGSDDYGI